MSGNSFSLPGRFQRNLIAQVVGCALVLFLAYQSAELLLAKSSVGAGIVLAACGSLLVLAALLTDWKRGVYFFIVWLCFEDFIRKYMGNNMVIFFAKDVLIGFVYLLFFIAVRRRRAVLFRPRFVGPVLVFVFLGVIQVFNPESSSLIFGLLGIKLYFYYMPLMFVGYAFLDSEIQLRRFLSVNLYIMICIGALGIAQSIIGPTFLNPTKLQAAIIEAGNLYRTAPLTGVEAYRPTSVFVSTGRFSDFLNLAWILAIGTAGYFISRDRKTRPVIFVALTIVFAAAVMCTSRGVFMFSLLNAAGLGVGFVWGASGQTKIALRTLRALRRIAIGAALGFCLLLFLFPNEVSSRLAIYSQTLLPESPTSELQTRVSSYPMENFRRAFDYPNWPLGYGIGTTSLGTQYVERYFGSVRERAVESGFGTLVVEFGILGLILWLYMSACILRESWKVVRYVRVSAFFPIALAFFWFQFLVLLPYTYAGMQAYQDYMNNSYLWLLTGMLFRLPSFIERQAILPVPSEQPAVGSA